MAWSKRWINFRDTARCWATSLDGNDSLRQCDPHRVEQLLFDRTDKAVARCKSFWDWLPEKP
jgi:hypothetical protein